MVWSPEKSHLDHWVVEAHAVVLSIPRQNPSPHFAAGYVCWRCDVQVWWIFSLDGNKPAPGEHTHTHTLHYTTLYKHKPVEQATHSSYSTHTQHRHLHVHLHTIIVSQYICYSPICYPAHFKAGQPTLKPAGQLLNGLAQFTTIQR